MCVFISRGNINKWKREIEKEKEKKTEGEKRESRKERGGVFALASAVVAVAFQQQRGAILKFYSISVI